MRPRSLLLLALLSVLSACRSTPSAVPVPLPPPAPVAPPSDAPPPARAALNDTGQSRCYDGVGLLACSMESTGDYAEFPRQDGRFGRDPQRLGFAFEGRDAKGGAVQAGARPACARDGTTGLLWLATPLKHGAWGELAAAVAEANAGKTCGRADWRVPSRRELVSIVDYGQVGVALDRRFFADASGVPHWTAEPGAQDPARRWTVQLNDGASYLAANEQKYPALLVAGAPAPPGGDYQLLGDGTVLDRRTGLLWDRCSVGQSGEGCETGTADKLPWAKALGAAVKANQARYKGHDDWRLPNVKELEALTEIGRFDPAIDPIFPRTAKYWYWTATPRPGEEIQMWDVGFDDAHIGFSFEEQYGYVRLVRNGDGYDMMR